MFHHPLGVLSGLLSASYLAWLISNWRTWRYHIHGLIWQERHTKYYLSNLLGDFLYPYRQVKQFVLNLYFYLPMLWNDRWYDSGYLLEYLTNRLRRDARMYETHGHHSEFQIQANEMKEVADICERLHKDEYFNAFGYDSHLIKWGNEIVKERTEQELIEFRIISKQAREAEENDLKRLGELFTHIRNWWD